MYVYSLVYIIVSEMINLTSLYTFVLLFVIAFSHSQERKPIHVEVKNVNGQYRLYRDGQPYFVKGAAGHAYLDLLVSSGGNSIRTWGMEGTEELLNEAHKHGLSVTFGLWVQHERHGFNYDNEEKVKEQLERFTETVRQFKDHPAVLAWGIGNEVDLFYTNTKVWDAVNDIAKMIHKEDPHHPTLTVTAGIDQAKVKLIQSKCPEIDILAINAYGDLPNIPVKLRTYGWTGPYMITEWGFTGHWEIAKTNWDAAIEETSSEKAFVYQTRYQQTIAADSNRCMGSYVFLWGNKMEYTPTWCGMFLASGEATQTVEVMQHLWSGTWPKNRAPQIKPLTLDRFSAKKSIVVAPNSLHRLAVEASDPDGDSLRYEWVLLPENTDKKAGGDPETKPRELKGRIVEERPGTALITAPSIVGAYRAYVYVYDDKGHAATANFPFYIENE